MQSPPPFRFIVESLRFADYRLYGYDKMFLFV